MLLVTRYWLFSDGVPGLFIEKGWVHDSINYSFSLPKEEEDEEEPDEGKQFLLYICNNLISLGFYQQLTKVMYILVLLRCKWWQ